MATGVDISFVPALQNTIVNLFSEDPDSIRSTVRNRTITGKTDKWERLGGVALVPVTSRHQATPHTPMTHSARRASIADFAGAEYLDQLDEVKMMIDPKNDYTQNLAKAWRRQVASTVITALNATATTLAADDSTGSASFPASQAIANAGTGLTLAKLRQANRILDNAGVPRDGDRTIITSAFGIEDLLADSQVTSSEYSSLNALMTGGIANGTRFMGMRWIMISDAVPDDTAVLTGGVAAPILPKTGNIRTSFVYHKSAVGLSFTMDGKLTVSTRPDLMDTWQVLIKGGLGAVRILDAGVVSLDFDESV